MKAQIFRNHKVIQRRIAHGGGKNNLPFFSSIFAVFILLTATTSCNKFPFPFPSHHQTTYQQVNLVADIASYHAAKIDAHLVNPWGIAIAPSGPIWVSDNHTGVTTIYDAGGNTLIPAITIPAADGKGIGSPTGQVFNSTADFIIPSNNEKSKFIFDSEDGVITAWSGGNMAVIVADRSAADAVYKGLAIGSAGSANFLYAANFKGGKIDVFDKNFKRITNMHFHDPNIPAGFAPFNIQNIGGKLFVTYAKQKGPDNEDDQAGQGNGYVDIFNTDGSFVKRFASKGALNSPWGITQSHDGFSSDKNDILIGNFGDGRINIYSWDGHFKGQLKDSHGKSITIDGLWAITFPANNMASDYNYLYFTAGPDDESHGLFGYLKTAY